MRKKLVLLIRKIINIRLQLFLKTGRSMA